MAGNDTLKIDFNAKGTDGTGVLVASVGGTAIYTTPADITKPADRKAFTDALLKDRPGINRAAVNDELEALAGKAAASDGEGDQQRRSQAKLLVELAADAELFHDGDGIAYATVPVGDHRETYKVNGKQFKLWLSRQLWQSEKKPAGAQAMQDALNVIGGKALFEGKAHRIAVRRAEHDGAVYLDLGDETWRAVKVTAEGWSVVSAPPVKFVRPGGMQSLPVPVTGGSLDELRAVVNLKDDHAWALAVAWLVGAMRPSGPYAVLVVNGEQGSAKSTTCEMLRRLIDPNKSDLRAAPKDDRDLVIAASNSMIVGFDNLSVVSSALSDALCRIATGAGFATRELFTDDGEKLFQVCRPIMFNGIEELATRPDLLERSVILSLTSIPETERRSKAEVWAAYEEARPRILGALLDAVSVALRNIAQVKLPTRPRMADFAEWVVAAEPALPFAPGTFLAAYQGNRDAATDLAIESSLVAPAVIALAAGTGRWDGTVKDLLAELALNFADEKTRKNPEWPTKPKALSNQLRRLAPVLRRAGVEVAFGGKTNRGKIVTVEWRGQSPSQPSPASPAPAREAAVREGDGVLFA